MRKKLALFLAASVLTAVLAVGGSLAYFTARQETENVFTVGNVSIDLTESAWNSDSLHRVYPGQVLSKDPTVTNTGANPCFVRIQVEGLEQFGNEGTIAWKTGSRLHALGKNWVDGGNGFFYYTQVLDAEAKTSPLFDSIVIPAGITDRFAGTAHTVTVSAQAVQAQGAREDPADVYRMTVSDIAAWFGTCGL